MTPKAFHALFARIGSRAKIYLPGAFAHAAAWLRVRPGTRAGGLAWNCHILPTNTRLKGGIYYRSIPDAARPC